MYVCVGVWGGVGVCGGGRVCKIFLFFCVIVSTPACRCGLLVDNIFKGRCLFLFPPGKSLKVV